MDQRCNYIKLDLRILVYLLVLPGVRKDFDFIKAFEIFDLTRDYFDKIVETRH